MSKVKTKIYLNKEYQNIKPSKVYELTAPNGYSILRIMPLTDLEKKLFDNANISWRETIIERDVNEKNIDINGISVDRVAPDELEIVSDNEDEARRKYNQLKVRLPEYVFLGHECTTVHGEPCTQFKSQTKITDQY